MKTKYIFYIECEGKRMECKPFDLDELAITVTKEDVIGGVGSGLVDSNLDRANNTTVNIINHYTQGE